MFGSMSNAFLKNHTPMTTPVYTTKVIFNCLKIRNLILVICFLGTVGLQAQVLTCPASFTINLPESDCAIPANYTNLTWTSTIPMASSAYFPAQGSLLPTGVNTILLTTTTAQGVLYTCNFTITILSYNANTFVCPPQANVSLSGECEHLVLASDVLDVNYFVCNQDYNVEMLNDSSQWVPAVVNATQVGQSQNVRLTHKYTGRTCQSLITVAGGEPSAITCPSNKTVLCNQPVDTASMGTPTLTGCFESVDLSYSDDFTFTQCGDSIAFQIERTFVAISPNGSQSSCSHLITAKRFSINLVVFPQDYDNIMLPAISCNDSLNLTQTAHPDVTGWPSVSNFVPNASFHCRFGISYLDNITPICGDSYRIRRAWTVVNLCLGQTRRDTQTILVVDQVPPSFEIPDSIFFSRSNSCIDSVFLPSANVVAECSGYSVAIASDFGNFTQNGVWIHPDSMPGFYEIDYTLTDQCGNDSTQTLTLAIADETLLECPPNDTITCDLYYAVISPAIQLNNQAALAVLGLPSFYENCLYTTSETNIPTVNGCGVGSIARSIQATNPTDTLVCEQTVYVEHVSNFEARFPNDTTLCVSHLQVDLPDPQLFSINCENVSITSTDMIVQSGLAGCYDIHRTWFVTNSCVFTGTENGADEEVSARRFRDNGDGRIAYVQTIHVNNNAALSFPNGCEIPDMYVGQADCEVEFLLASPVVAGCGAVIDVSATGSFGNVLGTTVSAGTGQYNVNFVATDECGKTQTCLTTFLVLDTIAPTVICNSNLEFDLQSTCLADVFALNFANNSVDNCPLGLDYSFAEDDPNDISKTFTICDLGQQTATVWVSDIFGNQSHCQVNFNVVSNMGNCGECAPTIGGSIEIEQGASIADVQVRIQKIGGGFEEITATNQNGEYQEYGDAGIADYEIRPELDTMDANGVTTFDLVLIRRHILNMDTLDSPYKIIAADANNSGTITTFDLVEIRKLILQVYDEFPASKSWRFVDASYTFPNPLNPFEQPFPEFIRLQDLGSDSLNNNFIGIKIGDVNASVDLMPFDGDPQLDED